MKKEYILLAIVTIALGAYLYFQDTDYTQYTLPQPAEINDADITKVEISGKSKRLILNKENGNWTVGEEKYPADTAKVISILDHLTKINLTALISESGNYARYELDDKNKISVTAWGNDKVLRRFDLGKTASSYKHTFIKLDGNKKVYHAEKNMKTALDTTEVSLTDKTILKLNPEAAYHLSVTDSGKKDEFGIKTEKVAVDINKDKEKEEGEKTTSSQPVKSWFTIKGKKVEKASIDDFIKKFSDLKCDNYVKGIKKDDLKEPVYSVSITTDRVYTLNAFKSDDKDSFTCTSSESNFPFKLNKSKIDGFREAFKKIE